MTLVYPGEMNRQEAGGTSFYREISASGACNKEIVEHFV
jgi:hypothetical protein